MKTELSKLFFRFWPDMFLKYVLKWENKPKIDDFGLIFATGQNFKKSP